MSGLKDLVLDSTSCVRRFLTRRLLDNTGNSRLYTYKSLYYCFTYLLLLQTIINIENAKSREFSCLFREYLSLILFSSYPAIIDLI